MKILKPLKVFFFAINKRLTKQEPSTSATCKLHSCPKTHIPAHVQSGGAQWGSATANDKK